MSKRSRTPELAEALEEVGRTKVCTAVSGRTPAQLRAKARRAFSQGTDLVEFRLDFLRPLKSQEVASVLSEFSERSIMTLRPRREGGNFHGSESARLEAIRALGELSPAFIDVELSTFEADPDLASELGGQSIIVSWHDHIKTPSKARLESVHARARAYGGLAKLIPTARKGTDNLAVLSLYDGEAQPPIAFCMGELGSFSRIMAVERGTPIAYASLPEEPTAPGQPTLSQLLVIRRQLASA